MSATLITLGLAVMCWGIYVSVIKRESFRIATHIEYLFAIYALAWVVFAVFLWFNHINFPLNLEAMDWPVHGPPLATLEQDVPYSRQSYNVTIISGTGLADHRLDWYQHQGYDYIVTSSFISQLSLVDRAEELERRSFYASLDEELELVKEFTPYKEDAAPAFIFDEIYGPIVDLWERERPGPILKIYHVGD